MPTYKNRISSPEHVEHKIVDEKGSPIGTFRLKPSSVLWRPKGKGKFYAVSLDKFRNWIMDPETKAGRVKN